MVKFVINILFLCFALGFFLNSVAALPKQPENPIIGIFVSPMADEGCQSYPSVIKNPSGCLESYYVRWLEAYGVRVVPFPWNMTNQETIWLAKRVNGILFPGGGLGGEILTEYYNRVKFIFDMTLEWNAKGDPFVLWGTCQGFQVLCSAAAGNLSVIEPGFPGMYPRMMNVQFTPTTQDSSKMFGNAPADVLLDLMTKPTTLNYHHMSVTPASFAANPTLNKYFRPLTVNSDPVNGRPFVSSVEARNANIFAVQFHPERPPYEFSEDKITHTSEDLKVSHYLAEFLKNRLKMNNHTFDSPYDAETYMIGHFPRTNCGWGCEKYWTLKTQNN